MKPNVRLIRGGVSLLLFMGLTSVAVWAQELSHARIVRLSFTEGIVTIQRPDIDEWANAPTNTPIQEGFKLATGESSFAEVEFENASTARIGQLSLLEFTQLALLPSGGKVNRMTLHQGYATFNVVPEGDDSYLVTAGNATFTPQGKTRFRVDFEEGAMLVKVFKGSVEIMSPEGTGTLGKNAVLEIRPGSAEPFLLAQGITKDAWDEWVEERESRMELARNHGAPVLYSNDVRDLMYGMMDLFYYGTWYSLPGYGYGWAPQMGMGWSPFTSGRWCWYPGMGYTWISYEPWGWLPYHYGGWIYDPIIGWCWIPTGFASWSPAVVSWYQGPGWVGWAPRSPTRGGSASNCPNPEGCVAVIGDDTFRSGRPVQPGGFRWGGRDIGRQIETVNVEPDRSAFLPGTARGLIGTFRREPGNDIGRAPAETATPEAVQGRMSVTGGVVNRPAGGGAGIVYDPQRGQYVDNPARAVAAPTTSTTTEVGPTDNTGVAGAVSLGVRPGPRANYPSRVTQDSFGASGSDRRGTSGARALSGDSDQGSGGPIGVSPGIWSRGGGATSGSGSSGQASSGSDSQSSGGSRSSVGSSSSGSSGSRGSSGSSSGWGGSRGSSGGSGSSGGGGSGGGGVSRGSSGGGGSSGGARGSIGSGGSAGSRTQR